MTLFNRILFPVDLSEASKKVVPYVREVTNKFGAELHMIYAAYIARSCVGPDFQAVYVDDAISELMGEAEHAIKEFIESDFKDISVKLKILAGPPGQEIIKYAGEEGMDLIIMGHSSTCISRAIFGSIAGYVVKYSHVPVLIISPSILENKAGHLRNAIKLF